MMNKHKHYYIEYQSFTLKSIYMLTKLNGQLNLLPCFPRSLISNMKDSFHVLDHALKALEHGSKNWKIHSFLMFSYHDQTLELVFHISRDLKHPVQFSGERNKCLSNGSHILNLFEHKK